jgi:hypothetical protein
MQALRDAVIVGHTALASLHEIEVIDDVGTEDIDRPREFLSQTGQCPLVSRVRALWARLLPPPPPVWLTLLVAAWTVYCGVMRAAVFVLLGPARLQAAFDETIMRLG